MLSVLDLRQRLHSEKDEDLVHQFRRPPSEIIELDDMNLFAREESEYAFHLFKVKTTIQIRRPSWLERQRLADPLALFRDCLKKSETFLVSLPIHVPMREGAINRIPQENDELDPGVVVPNSLHRRLPVGVNRGARTRDERSSFKLYPFVQDFVIDLARKPIFIIEEVAARVVNHMRFLAMSHRDVGMLREMIVQRARPAFLGPRDNEIQPLYRLS